MVLQGFLGDKFTIIPFPDEEKAKSAESHAKSRFDHVMWWSMDEAYLTSPMDPSLRHPPYLELA
jgi:hypothetical protein